MTPLESLAPVALLALSWLARSTVILLLALVVVRLLRQGSAALRHSILLGGIVASLLVAPLSTLGLTAFVPRSAVAYPHAIVGLFSDARRADPAPTAARPGPPLDIALDVQAASTPARSWQAATLGMFALIWLAGVVLLGLRIGLSRVAAARLRRRAQRISDPMLQAMLACVGRAHGLGRVPELRLSDELPTPATLGCWRPMVLLPSAATTWPPERLEPILAHELAHIVRRDGLTSLLRDVACAVYWCSPLIWLVARRLTVERECACDDRALLSGVEPARYGMLLLDVARGVKQSAPAAALMMARPSGRELESRLLAIMANVDRSAVPRRRMVLIGVLTALLGTVAAGRPAVTEPHTLRTLQPDSLAAPASKQTARHRSALDTAPSSTNVVASQSVVALEPDRRGDSLASPLSERVPHTANADSLAAAVRDSPLWNGPDSALARLLATYLTHTQDEPYELGRKRAIWALSRGRGEALVDPLLESLGDADWRVRAYAAWTLGIARERRAVPALIEALGHPVWRMRAMAASALLDIGDPSAMTAMVRALGDEAWQVRWPGVSFVAAYTDSTVAARVLTPLLRDRHIAVRLAAAEALARRSSHIP